MVVDVSGQGFSSWPSLARRLARASWASTLVTLSGDHRLEQVAARSWAGTGPLDHLGQPHRIQLSVWGAGEVLEVAGVGSQQLNLGFEQGERRLPGVAGGLGRDQRHPSSVPPGGQAQQRPGVALGLPDFLAAVSRLVVVGTQLPTVRAAFTPARGVPPGHRRLPCAVKSVRLG